MTRQGNVISGTFVHLAEKSSKKNDKKNVETQKSQEENSSDESEDEKKQKEEDEQEKSVQEIKLTGKRGRKKKDSDDEEEQKPQKQKKAKVTESKDEALKEFKKLMNQAVKQFKTPIPKKLQSKKSKIPEQLLSKLIALPRSVSNDCSFNSLMYLAEKYSWILVLRKAFESRKKIELEKTLEKKYVGQDDLRQMCQQRELQYEKRRLYSELTVVSHDLLEVWYKNRYKSSLQHMGQQEPYPYAYLLETYRSQPNKPALLQSVMRKLQNMSEQTVIKIQQRQKKLPQLSLKFISALIYITSLITNQTITILQVINTVLNGLSHYYSEYNSTEIVEKKDIILLMITEKNVRVKRVKKISHKLFEYLEEFVGEQALCVEKWCDKFCAKMFKIPQKNHKQIQVLTETLITGYMDEGEESSRIKMMNSNHVVHNTRSNRYLFLQQPEIVLSALVIYLKLVFGLDRGQYPYLKTIGEIKEFIEQNKQYLRKQQDLDKIQYLLEIVKNQPHELNDNHQFQLGDFLKAVNNSFRPLSTFTQLTDLSHKTLADITKTISQFRNLPHNKQQHKLTLMSNFSSANRSNINQNQNSNQGIGPIQVFYAEETRPKDEAPDLFKHTTSSQVVSLTEQAAKALDYLYDKHKRYVDKVNKLKQQKLSEPEKNNSETLLSEQFKISDHIDKPQRHYEIVFHPTINNLSQLKYPELLTLVENLCFLLNGEYSDCKDILEWMGFFEAALKHFQP